MQRGAPSGGLAARLLRGGRACLTQCVPWLLGLVRPRQRRRGVALCVRGGGRLIAHRPGLSRDTTAATTRLCPPWTYDSAVAGATRGHVHGGSSEARRRQQGAAALSPALSWRDGRGLLRGSCVDGWKAHCDLSCMQTNGVALSRFLLNKWGVCVSCPPFFKAPRFALCGGWDT